MARPSPARQQEIQQQCFALWQRGLSHTDIAQQVQVAPNTVTKYVKKFLAAQPIASLSKEEREAFVFAEWQEIADKLRVDIEEQRQRGRMKVTRTRHPDGSETVEQSMLAGVDPQLYRAWGAHLDRKARQLLDQMPVIEGGQTVNVSIVREFLQQGQAPAGKLSAEGWNEQAVDV